MTRRLLPALLLSALGLPAAALAQTAPDLRLSGEVRLRTEFDARTPEATDHATLLRTRLGLGATVSPQARLFAQLQDARALGEGPGTTQARALRLDLHQAWVELGDTVLGRPWTARLGRQEIALGDERLVGAVGWTNVGRSFDGARLRTGGLDLIATTIRETARLGDAGLLPRANEGVARDHLFGGAHLQGRHGAMYLFHDRGGTAAGRVEVDRTTPGARLAVASGALAFSAEGAAQVGRQTVEATGERQQIRAWMGVGRAGWSRPAGALRNVTLGVDWLSGGDDPLGAEYRAFNTLYGTNHRFYGFMDLFLDPAAQTGGRGLVDALASTTVALGPRLPLEVTAHHFQLARSAPEGRNLGWEVDLTLPFPAAQGVRGLTGYSLFRTGSAAPAAALPPGEWLHWAFVQLSVAF
jgi:hypothetical protein